MTRHCCRFNEKRFSTLAESQAFIEDFELSIHMASLGGVESLVKVLSLMLLYEVSHGSPTVGVLETLVRLSVDIETPTISVRISGQRCRKRAFPFRSFGPSRSAGGPIINRSQQPQAEYESVLIIPPNLILFWDIVSYFSPFHISLWIFSPLYLDRWDISSFLLMIVDYL
ncbi:PLP-dependent transferase [Haloarcula sp. 1CSR25-25]|nr:PLP-dependent transferase [Haloarcula sp. 1CSR25-25]